VSTTGAGAVKPVSGGSQRKGDSVGLIYWMKVSGGRREWGIILMMSSRFEDEDDSRLGLELRGSARPISIDKASQGCGSDDERFCAEQLSGISRSKSEIK
jgi:hypothetical protein